MVEPVVVDPQLVSKKILECRGKLERPAIGFSGEIAKRDSPFGSGRLSLEACVARESFEYFLGTAAAMKKTLGESHIIDCNYQVREQFIDLFSFYAGASAGASFLDSQPKKPSANYTLQNKHKLDFSRGEYLLFDDLVKTYLTGTAKCTNGEMLVSGTNDFLQWIVSEAEAQKDSALYAEFTKRMGAARIKLNGIIINGFSSYRSERADVKIGSASREDYVGNKALLNALDSAVVDLFDYDMKEKRNPNLDAGGFRQTFTLWGEGGMGKTYGMKVVLNEAKAIAEKMSLPFFVRELRGFKSEYFGKSAQNLRQIFDEIKKGDAVYAVIAEDIDTIFFSREALKERPEDKDILGEIMNQLEGLSSNTLGNSILLATSNHPLEGDGPLMDRLRQGQIHVKGPQNPEEYAAVFKSNLKDGINAKYVVIRDFEKIGGLAQENSLSNRDIKNICLEVMVKTKNYERPANFHSIGYAEKVAYLRSNRNRIDDSDIIGAIKGYAKGIADQRKKDFEAAVNSEVERYKIGQAVEKRITDG